VYRFAVHLEGELLLEQTAGSMTSHTVLCHLCTVPDRYASTLYHSLHSSIASPLFSTLIHCTKSSITLGQLLSSLQKLRLSSCNALVMKARV
jgi:hypothetical protein